MIHDFCVFRKWGMVFFGRICAVSFEVVKEDLRTQARLGRLHTPHGTVETPVFMDVGTLGTVKALEPRDLVETGAQVVLGNTYHLMLRPGADIIAAAGGRYVWAGDSSREIVLPLESVYALADSADVWVNPGMFSTPEEILAADPRAASLRAFKQKHVCQNDGVMSLGGGNDFYEGAAPRPAELLLNLHGCLYPDSAAFPESAKAAPESAKAALESADASIRGYLEAFSGNPAYKWYRNIYNSLHYE